MASDIPNNRAKLLSILSDMGYTPRGLYNLGVELSEEINFRMIEKTSGVIQDFVVIPAVEHPDGGRSDMYRIYIKEMRSNLRRITLHLP